MAKKRILIVDDEEDLTWTISRRLNNGKKKMEILCANSGKAALKMLAENKIDLLLTDLRMPEINGFQLIDEAIKSYPGINVVVMTAYGSSDIKERFENFSNIGYIEKPFEINELRKLVFRAL
ncbi:response regulator [bacterium]|nr:response regulator [bacterium]